jgi:ERCC4-type nuclease
LIYNVIHDRFGSWNDALRAAGLHPSNAAIDLSQPVTELVDEIDGFGEFAAQSLEEAGYETVGDLHNATEAELRDVNRIGPATAEKLLSYATL